MKLLLSITIIIISFTKCFSQDRYVQLKGGYDSLYKAIKYETLLQECSEHSGNVFVDFEVTELGTTRDAKVVRGICPKADSTALDIVQRLKYIPAKRNGKSIAIKQTLKIYFTKKE